MPDLAAYASLFLSAFASATLLPGSSEAVLVGMMMAGYPAGLGLVAVATAGNVLGSVVNWVLGRFFARLRDRPWFPVDRGAYDRAVRRYRRFGSWTLLLAWVPIVGDPLTLAAGVLRVDLARFLVLVTIGKALRYLVLVAAYRCWTGC